jgi:hypothetical protein
MAFSEHMFALIKTHIWRIANSEKGVANWPLTIRLSPLPLPLEPIGLRKALGRQAAGFGAIADPFLELGPCYGELRPEDCTTRGLLRRDSVAQSRSGPKKMRAHCQMGCYTKTIWNNEKADTCWNRAISQRRGGQRSPREGS